RGRATIGRDLRRFAPERARPLARGAGPLGLRLALRAAICLNGLVRKLDAPDGVPEGLLLTGDIGVGAGRARRDQALEQGLVLTIINHAARRIGVAVERLDGARQQRVVIDPLDHSPAIAFCRLCYQMKAETGTDISGGNVARLYRFCLD